MLEPSDAPKHGKDESLADKFRLEEFRVLRGEIELRASEQRAMERNVVILAASIYAFLLYPKGGAVDDGDQPFLMLAWYLPSLFRFLALVRWRESLKMIEALAEYLRRLEKEILGENGWETFLVSKREKGNLPMFSLWYALFWTIACVGTLVVAYLRHPGPYKIATAIALAAMGTTCVLWLVMRRRFLSQN